MLISGVKEEVMTEVCNKGGGGDKGVLAFFHLIQKWDPSISLG